MTVRARGKGHLGRAVTAPRAKLAASGDTAVEPRKDSSELDLLQWDLGQRRHTAGWRAVSTLAPLSSSKVSRTTKRSAPSALYSARPPVTKSIGSTTRLAHQHTRFYSRPRARSTTNTKGSSRIPSR